MRPEFKLWIENEEGEQIIGEGLMSLLKMIEKTGSINKASDELNMSYRTAWGKIEKIEKRLGEKLIKRKTGGAGVGGSELTEKGRTFMNKYHIFSEGITQCVNEDFARIFADYLQS